MRVRQSPTPPRRRSVPQLLAARAAAPLLLLAPLLPGSGAARAQTLTIPEYRELILSKESVVARLDRELDAANSDLDRLVAQKQAAGSPRGQRSREVSAEIVKASQRIADLERQRRAARSELATLRNTLNERYTQVIDANLERLGQMPQSDPAYGALLMETGRYVSARDSLQLQIRIQETLGSFRDFPILPTDGPAEIREKAGFYQDYVHDVDQKIEAVDGEIDRIRERERVARRMQELQEDLAFQGEDVPKRPTDVSGGDIREDPAVNAPAGLEALASGPARRIADLDQERRSLELLRRRFQAKVRDYENRARTIYSRETTQSGGQNR